MTIFRPKWSLKGNQCLFSIAGLPFSLTTTHLKVGMVRRRLSMMFLIHQAFVTTEFTLVVVSSNWKSGKFVIIAVQTSYSLTDDSYLSLRHLSVISVTRIVLPQQILFVHQECVHLCLPLFVCPVCHFAYITRSCLRMHITESHGGPKAAISLF